MWTAFEADRNLNRVNAADQGYVKARLNRTTNAPTSGTQAAYTIHGNVLLNDAGTFTYATGVAL